MPVIKPIHYNINIHPDLSTFTFTGSCGIHFQVDEAVTEVTLDTLELEINTCMVKLENEGKKEIEQHCEFHLKPKEEKLIIVLPFSCKGEFILFITYKGEINNKMAGFYRSSYKTGKERKYIGVTQFEESDARRAFPCMDHPLWKARFTVEMVIDSHLQAISNEDSVKEEELPEEKRLIRFKTTPKMSTYLLFFGVGAFEMITDSKDSRIRLYTVPGKIE